MGVSWGHCLSKSDWVFFSEGPSNYWTEGFLLKAFHGSCKMKVSTKCFVWGHSAKKSDRVFFSGSSSDSRIRRFLWKYFKKTWRHLKKPQNSYHVILNVLFIWLKVLHCQHEWTNEWIFLLSNTFTSLLVK